MNDIKSLINNRVSGYSRKSAYKGYNDGIFINIGGGGFHHNRWVNLDFANPHYNWEEGTFLEYDITKRLPLPYADGSVNLVYCSHVIEHLHNLDVQFLFSEIYRVLSVNGLYRLTCPNADLVYSLLKINKANSFSWRNRWFKGHGCCDVNELRPVHFVVRETATARSRYLGGTHSMARFSTPEANPKFIEETIIERAFREMPKVDFLNWLTNDLCFDPNHSGDHLNWWNYDKIRDAMILAGFKEIFPSSCGASCSAPMRDFNHFDNTRPMMSIYVEAIK